MITSAAAPAVLEAGPAATPVADTAASGVFDAILLLQGGAATANTLDAAAFEASDTTDALAADDAGDDDTDEDIDASLAFLADLIAALKPHGGSAGAGEFSGSSTGDGGAAADEAMPLIAAALDADGGFALGSAADRTGKTEPLSGLVPTPAELDAKSATGDASQNLARAVEMLSQPRASTAEATRPAILTHARDPRWADDFGTRVSLMVRAGESSASLAMTPVDLGPVEVNVTVKDSQATIQFAATQAETRALIEASLPKLRELLAAQGFNLLDASVSSGFSRSQQPAFGSTTRGGADGESEASISEARVVRQLGLLDTYA